jgi:hypothetical protein
MSSTRSNSTTLSGSINNETTNNNNNSSRIPIRSQSFGITSIDTSTTTNRSNTINSTIISSSASTTPVSSGVTELNIDPLISSVSAPASLSKLQLAESTQIDTFNSHLSAEINLFNSIDYSNSNSQFGSMSSTDLTSSDSTALTTSTTSTTITSTTIATSASTTTPITTLSIGASTSDTAASTTLILSGAISTMSASTIGSGTAPAGPISAEITETTAPESSQLQSEEPTVSNLLRASEIQLLSGSPAKEIAGSSSQPQPAASSATSQLLSASSAGASDLPSAASQLQSPDSAAASQLQSPVSAAASKLAAAVSAGISQPPPAASDSVPSFSAVSTALAAASAGSSAVAAAEPIPFHYQPPPSPINVVPFKSRLLEPGSNLEEQLSTVESRLRSAPLNYGPGRTSALQPRPQWSTTTALLQDDRTITIVTDSDEEEEEEEDEDEDEDEEEEAKNREYDEQFDHMLALYVDRGFEVAKDGSSVTSPGGTRYRAGRFPSLEAREPTTHPMLDLPDPNEALEFESVAASEAPTGPLPRKVLGLHPTQPGKLQKKKAVTITSSQTAAAAAGPESAPTTSTRRQSGRIRKSQSLIGPASSSIALPSPSAGKSQSAASTPAKKKPIAKKAPHAADKILCPNVSCRYEYNHPITFNNFRAHRISCNKSEQELFDQIRDSDQYYRRRCRRQELQRDLGFEVGELFQPLNFESASSSRAETLGEQLEPSAQEQLVPQLPTPDSPSRSLASARDSQRDIQLLLQQQREEFEQRSRQQQQQQQQEFELRARQQQQQQQEEFEQRIQQQQQQNQQFQAQLLAQLEKFQRSVPAPAAPVPAPEAPRSSAPGSPSVAAPTLPPALIAAFRPLAAQIAPPAAVYSAAAAASASTGLQQPTRAELLTAHLNRLAQEKCLTRNFMECTDYQVEQLRKIGNTSSLIDEYRTLRALIDSGLASTSALKAAAIPAAIPAVAPATLATLSAPASATVIVPAQQVSAVPTTASAAASPAITAQEPPKVYLVSTSKRRARSVGSDSSSSSSESAEEEVHKHFRPLKKGQTTKYRFIIDQLKPEGVSTLDLAKRYFDALDQESKHNIEKAVKNINKAAKERNVRQRFGPSLFNTSGYTAFSVPEGSSSIQTFHTQGATVIPPLAAQPVYSSYQPFPPAAAAYPAPAIPYVQQYPYPAAPMFTPGYYQQQLPQQLYPSPPYSAPRPRTSPMEITLEPPTPDENRAMERAVELQQCYEFLRHKQNFPPRR